MDAFKEQGQKATQHLTLLPYSASSHLIIPSWLCYEFRNLTHLDKTWNYLTSNK